MTRRNVLRGTLIALSAGLAGCISPASSLVVGRVRPAIDVSQVKVYLRPPKRFEEVAVLESSSMYSWAVTEQGKLDAVIATMKGEAAKIGANGILIQTTGSQQAGSVVTGSGTATRVGSTTFGSGAAFAVPMMVKAGSGIAIYVTEE